MIRRGAVFALTLTLFLSLAGGLYYFAPAQTILGGQGGGGVGPTGATGATGPTGATGATGPGISGLSAFRIPRAASATSLEDGSLNDNGSGSLTFSSGVSNAFGIFTDNGGGLRLGTTTALLDDGNTFLAIGVTATGMTLGTPHMLTVKGGTPTCGTGCASIAGNDNGGVITTNATITSVVLNFSATLAAAPVCTVNGTLINPTITSITSSALTMALTSTPAETVYYQCRIYPSP